MESTKYRGLQFKGLHAKKDSLVKQRFYIVEG